MKKKIILLGLVLIFCINLSAAVWADEAVTTYEDEPQNVDAVISNEDSMYQGMTYEQFATTIRDMYESDSEFIAHKEYDPVDAEEMLEYVIDNLWNLQFANSNENMSLDHGISTRGYNDNGSWVNAPCINQVKTHYCGPASALNAIAGWGGYVQGENGSSTNMAKMDTLAVSMGISKVNESSGAMVYRVRNTLNS